MSYVSTQPLLLMFNKMQFIVKLSQISVNNRLPLFCLRLRCNLSGRAVLVSDMEWGFFNLLVLAAVAGIQAQEECSREDISHAAGVSNGIFTSKEEMGYQAGRYSIIVHCYSFILVTPMQAPPSTKLSQLCLAGL